MIQVRITTKNPITGAWDNEYKSVSKKELESLKKQAIEDIKQVPWGDASHLVYYAELLDNDNKIYFANIYLDGTYDPCDDEKLEKIYQRKRVVTYVRHKK